MAKARFRITNDCITIHDVDTVLKKDALELIKKLRERNPNYEIFKRSDRSLYDEFCVHKWFYKLGIKKDRTQHAGIQYPLPKIEKITYCCLGWLSRLFIK